MTELSSPLQIAGFLETNCSSDRGIFSIYRFVVDDYGTDSIGFAFFYGPEKDMDSKWLKKVKRLWENGTITTHGQEFLDENWQLDISKRVYRNNKKQTIKFGAGPFGRDGEKIDLNQENPSDTKSEESPRPNERWMKKQHPRLKTRIHFHFIR